MANNFPNLRFMSNWGLPDVHRFGALHGVPTSVVNQIYNAADVVVSTTLGEGWGLSYTEAMAAGSPVIAPRNTSGLEVIGEKDERGLLYACGDHPSAFVMMANDNDRIRPLPNIEDLVEKLETVYRDREMALSRCAAAHDWVEKLHWDGDTIGRRWLDLLQGAWLDLNAASPRGEGLPEGRA
jgi:glycosyltransferase involved in cell wall biosynthesis